MDLFTQLEDMNKQVPLAELLRPKALDDFLGQSNVVAPNSPLLNLLESLIINLNIEERLVCINLSNTKRQIM